MNAVARVNIDLPDSLHREAKAAAALQGRSLKDFVILALQEAVRKQS